MVFAPITGIWAANKAAEMVAVTINLTELGLDAFSLIASGGGSVTINHADIPHILGKAENARVVKLRIENAGFIIDSVCRSVQKLPSGRIGVLDAVATVNLSAFVSGGGLVELRSFVSTPSNEYSDRLFYSLTVTPLTTAT